MACQLILVFLTWLSVAENMRIRRKVKAPDKEDYVRVILKGDVGASTNAAKDNPVVTLKIASCAHRNDNSVSSLPIRSAYKDMKLECKKNNDLWTTKINGVDYYLKRLATVKTSVSALDGAHHFKDALTSTIDDGKYSSNQNFWFIGSSSSQLIGQLADKELVKELTSNDELKKKVGQRETVRFIVDLKPSNGGALQCPEQDQVGSNAYGPSDNFKLMVFARGSPCARMAKVSPPGTEQYCLDAHGSDLRGWAVAIDLNQAKPVVRNPGLEKGEGLAINCLPESVKRKHKKTLIPQWVDPKGEHGDHRCRYVAYSPEQYLAKETTGLINRAKVVINTNFFLFVDIRELPCATPLGPVVSDGTLVQTYSQTEKDMHAIRWPKAFEHVKAHDVLVMYRGVAFLLPAAEFDGWFEQLWPWDKKNVNAITGHIILKNGKPVDQRRDFARAGNEYFWTGNYARTVIGVQYNSLCNITLPSGSGKLKCGTMLVLLQFEMNSQGRTVITFFDNATMNSNDRPPSAGVSLPEVQEILQFMMIDDALNFDGSGSSSLWTSIGDLKEKRSQPSDVLDDERGRLVYQFRPSPTLLAFEPMP